MSETTWKRNTSGMLAHAHQRKAAQRKLVDEAISRLLGEHHTISFPAGAKAARVSKAYLYNQPDLRERIEVLRQQQVEQSLRERTTRPATGKTDGSRALMILAKDRRIKELEAENRKLQHQLKGALSKGYDQL